MFFRRNKSGKRRLTRFNTFFDYVRWRRGIYDDASLDRLVEVGWLYSSRHPSEETLKKVLESLEGHDFKKETEEAYRLAVAMRGTKWVCDDNGYGESS